MRTTPHPYQADTVELGLEWLLDRDEPGLGLFADPGLGKTLMTLMLLDQMRDLGPVLLVAPLRPVYDVWPAEVEKHGFDFRVSIVHGPKKAKALATPADIYVTNPESLKWLRDRPHPCRVLVVDESTLFKNWSAQRSKYLRKMLPRFLKRIELSGTPIPKGYDDLHSQIYILDDGERLGRTATWFRQEYCYQGGFSGREWKFRQDKAERLEAAIADTTLRLDMHDHLDLPPLVVNDVEVSLPAAVRDQYVQLETELFAELESGDTLVANSAGAKYTLCRQVANGGAYQTDEFGSRAAVYVHEAKLDALSDIVEGYAGKPVLCAYAYNHDRDRILGRYPDAKVICRGVKPAGVSAILQAWSAGEVPLLLVQPQSLSHGVNMQEAGNDIVWFGLPDQLELYLQLNARLHRQGVKSTVRIHRLVARDTVDELVVARVDDKDKTQKSLLAALKEYKGKSNDNNPKSQGSANQAYQQRRNGRRIRQGETVHGGPTPDR